MSGPAAVVLDMDGVILDSEQVWDEVRRRVVADGGGRWTDAATSAMQGMSTPEWAAYLVDELGLRATPGEAAARVLAGVRERYGDAPPFLPGAADAVRRWAGRWPLGLASSSSRDLIDLVLNVSGLAADFAATVSSEEVAHGKPAPDVYLAVAERLGVRAADCAAVEDSANGLRSAAAAGMRVVAVPNTHFPPPADALALAAATAPTLAAVTDADLGA